MCPSRSPIEERLGVSAENIYTGHGLTGTKRSRPGSEKMVAACRADDTPSVVKSVRSLCNACDIVDELDRKQVVLDIGGARLARKNPTAHFQTAGRIGSNGGLMGPSQRWRRPDSAVQMRRCALNAELESRA